MERVNIVIKLFLTHYLKKEGRGVKFVFFCYNFYKHIITSTKGSWNICPFDEIAVNYRYTDQLHDIYVNMYLCKLLSYAVYCKRVFWKIFAT